MRCTTSAHTLTAASARHQPASVGADSSTAMHSSACYLAPVASMGRCRRVYLDNAQTKLRGREGGKHHGKEKFDGDPDRGRIIDPHFSIDNWSNFVKTIPSSARCQRFLQSYFIIGYDEKYSHLRCLKLTTSTLLVNLGKMSSKIGSNGQNEAGWPGSAFLL